MTPQDKINVLAEMDGRYKPICLTSRDAIVPLIVKWCGDSFERKSKFGFELSKMQKQAHETIDSYVARFQSATHTAEQLSDALIKAAGKWKE